MGYMYFALQTYLIIYIPLFFHLPAFEVDVTYNGTGSYTLSSPSPSPSSTGDEPEDGTESVPSWSVSASGRLSREGGSLVLSGFVGEERVRANLAVIDDTLHIFTAVSAQDHQLQ